MIKFRKVESSLPFRISLFSALLVVRSQARLFHPQVWVEDGAVTHVGSNIGDFVTHGPAALFRPVNSYLVLLPKLVSGLSLLISFSHYAAISTVLSCAVTVFAVTLVASSKTQLRGGTLLGVLALMVPSDPEVFALPIYTFWWAALLLFAAILWEKDSRDLKWRLPIVWIGGLSSPIIVGIAPVFLLRAYLYRKTCQEWAVSASAIVCAMVQFVFLNNSGLMGSAPGAITATKLAHVVPTFFGNYLLGNLIPGPVGLRIAGVALAAFAAVALARSWAKFQYCCLAALFLIVVLMTMRRVDIAILHPRLAGPRYFFLPFILISWLMAQVISGGSSRYWKIAGWVIIAASLANAVPVLSRKQDDLYWRQHVLSCPWFERYSIPIEYDGRASHVLHLQLTGEECRALLSRDLFRHGYRTPFTFPYASLPANDPADRASLAGAASVTENRWQAFDLAGADLRAWKGISAYKSPAAATGSIRLQLIRGETVLYRTGPATNSELLIDGGRWPFLRVLLPAPSWRLLSFSNALLPERFSVTFVRPAGSRQWVAIALTHSQTKLAETSRLGTPKIMQPAAPQPFRTSRTSSRMK